MLPSPTAEGVLIMAALYAHTSEMSEGECSAFRRSMKYGLTRDNPKIVFLRQAVPTLDAARDGGVVMLHTACGICERREACPKPVS